MIRIALSGDRGRMGKCLGRLIKKSSFMKVIAGANRDISPKSWKASQIDAVIDFSLPDLFTQSLNWAVQNNKLFVSGTTGLKLSHKKALKTAGKTIPVFYGENMSGGVFLLTNWLTKRVDEKAKILIEDIHHKNKKDTPSGTALRLKKSLPVFLRKKAKIKSVRKGKEFGTHRITLKSSEEFLLLEHRALNRDLFAKGALQALLFIFKKKKGYYESSDLYLKRKLPSLF